jgi:tetratricopeptide (TPR) repeat protein
MAPQVIPTVLDHDTAPAPQASDVARGEHIARYVVLEHVGAGGMGVVYAAYDPELDRKVAIKLLQGDEGESQGSLGRARLLREAQALARLTHPNVVAVHDVGTWQGRVFVAMEFVHGTTLGRWLAARPRSPREIVGVFVQAGEGLQAAHTAGLLHRDFKPDNVMIGEDGRVRVLDFGLARTAGATPLDVEPTGPDGRDRSDRGSRLDSRLTRTGAMAGTPAYMAPEQHRGGELDARTDQFSFCVALWESLCGERPFGGNDRISLVLAVCSGQRRAIPASVSIPPRWRRALERGLSVAPEDRFASMAELLAELTASSRRAPLAVGLGAAGLFAAVLLRTTTPTEDPCATAGERIAASWNDEARARLSDGLAVADPVRGPGIAARVVPQLDRYAAAWTGAAQDACTATFVRHEQSESLLDRRVACLDGRLAGFDRLVRELSRADEAATRKAVDATVGLPALDACADATALLDAIAPPTDADAAREVLAVREAIAETRIVGELGRFGEAYDAADELVARAKATSHLPVVAEAAVLAGDLAHAAGRRADAVGHLRDGLHAAIASGHVRMHHAAALELAHAVGVGESRYDEGLEWAAQAAAVLDRIGHGGIEHASTSETMCKLLADKGDIAVALAHCVRGVEIATALWGTDDPRSARAREGLAIALYLGGRFAEAEAEFLAVEALTRAANGPDHPHLARLENSLAATCMSLRNAASCVGSFEKAVDAAIRGFGPQHDSVADFSNNLAMVLVTLGRLDEAEVHVQRALAIRARDAEHPGIAASTLIVARIAEARGDLGAAIAGYDRALALFRRTRGDRHHDVMDALERAGLARVRHGDAAAGRALLVEALDVGAALQRPREELAALEAEIAAIDASPATVP